MPIRDNWIDSPLDFITDTIENSGELNLSEVREYFEGRVKSLENFNQIPSLNNVPLEEIKPNSLVRCCCMVQDQFDPEYYLGLFETHDRSDGRRRVRMGVYRDSSDCGKDEEIIHESSKNITLERQSLYCVPVPAENEWVKTEHASQRPARPESASMETSEAGKGNKRPRDVEMEEEEEGDIDDIQKKQRAADVQLQNRSSAGNQLEAFQPNFPLPDERGRPCMVIMYETEDTLKLNEVVEFIGILSCDASLAAATMQDSLSEGETLTAPGMMSAEELSVHCPPPSLVPRLHCITSRRINHSNPLISVALTEGDYESSIQHFIQDSASIRQNVIDALSNLLFGDRLAAEYVLLNLISRVYGRADVMALGKFSFNLTKCPSAGEPTVSSLPDELGKFIELITTKSHYIPLTISNLNNQRFVPKKDYNVNRLLSGTLQLSEGTHLVLDETVMEPGRLDSNGVQNVTAIGNVVQWQKVEYDFSFHKCDMKTDISVLILSEGRSLVQCDCMMPLVKQENSCQRAQTVVNSMDPSLLSKIRIYLDVVRLMKFDLSNEMQERVKEDYVKMRETDPKSINPEAFHILLAVARLVALSHGKNHLTPELWEKTKELENARRQR